MGDFMKNRNGYSLLELIIAMGLLALLAGPFVSIFVDSLKINKMSDNVIKANYIAQKYMEEYKSKDNLGSTVQTFVEDGFDIKVEYEFKESDLKTATSTTVETFDNSVLYEIDEVLTYYYNANEITLKNNIKEFEVKNAVDRKYVLRLDDSGVSKIREILEYSTSSSNVESILGEFTITDNRFVISFNSQGFDSENLPAPFEITIENNSKYDIYVYSYDNDFNLIMLKFKNNSIDTDIVYINNLTMKSESNFNDEIFNQVIVTVSKNGIEYAKIVSGIKK